MKKGEEDKNHCKQVDTTMYTDANKPSDSLKQKHPAITISRTVEESLAAGITLQTEDHLSLNSSSLDSIMRAFFRQRRNRCHIDCVPKVYQSEDHREHEN